MLTEFSNEPPKKMSPFLGTMLQLEGLKWFKACNSLTEGQRKEKAKSLEIVKAQAEELEALLLVNKGEEVSRLSQAVNVISKRPS
uniref:Uncharacterized protein n=1 Tax=Globodera rostochiensis TaxID=31243 RepID=A0A914HKY2_GLORO